MKKILALLLVGLVALIVVQRQRSAKAEADLWREAGDISEWNLDVVAAFMRAAYGKGYCDALTEDAPGSLCQDHGYRKFALNAMNRAKES